MTSQAITRLRPLRFGFSSDPFRLAQGQRVDVYYNLHKKRLSIRALDGKDKGRIIGHADSLTLRNVRFVVNEAGRQRVLAEKRKNVHAFVRGILTSVNAPLSALDKTFRRLTYNPYKYDHFVTMDTETPVIAADEVLIQGRNILARLPVLKTGGSGAGNPPSAERSDRNAAGS